MKIKTRNHMPESKGTPSSMHPIHHTLATSAFGQESRDPHKAGSRFPSQCRCSNLVLNSAQTWCCFSGRISNMPPCLKFCSFCTIIEHTRNGLLCLFKKGWGGGCSKLERQRGMGEQGTSKASENSYESTHWQNVAKQLYSIAIKASKEVKTKWCLTF